MHSSAFKDPVWQLTSKLFLSQVSDENSILAAKACVNCHVAATYLIRKIQSSADNYDTITTAPENGIFCDFCHSIKDSHGTGNAAYIIDPLKSKDDTGIKYGPHANAKSDFHANAYSDLHTRSEFCGICHDVFHVSNLIPIESTYTEWKHSPYNTGNPKTSIHCQDCHMRQLPGKPATGKTPRLDNPGRNAKNGPLRPHIWAHYFVGGSVTIPKLMGSDIHSQMAIELLQNAAEVQIANPQDWKHSGLAEVRVKIKNTGAGHYLPTGITELRQMWLAITVTDAKGKIVFTSGNVDKENNIETGTTIFNTVLGDAEGNPVVNIALATHILTDYRIPPKGYVINKYHFLIPRDIVPPLKIKAVLKYRSAPQKLINDLLKDKAPTLAIIDMASATKQVNIKPNF